MLCAMLASVACGEADGSRDEPARAPAVTARDGGPSDLAPTDDDASPRVHGVVRGPDGPLADALVWLDVPDTRRSTDAADESVTLRFAEGGLAPRVLAAHKGATLVVDHSEATTMHNAHPYPPWKPDVGGMPRSPLPQKFHLKRRTKTPFPVKCDVHADERSWVGVFAHDAFAVTDASGRFDFASPGLEGGETLHAWHPDHDPLDRTLDLDASRPHELALELAPRAD